MVILVSGGKPSYVEYKFKPVFNDGIKLMLAVFMSFYLDRSYSKILEEPWYIYSHMLYIWLKACVCLLLHTRILF